MFAEAVNQTAGIGIGIFLGVLVGFTIRARKGNVQGMFQGSVWKTAVLAGMLAWFTAAILAMVF